MTTSRDVLEALASGDSFWTTGEVLIRNMELKRDRNGQKLSVEVEWTYPLEFVELVWGDGKKTGRSVVSTQDLAPFSSHRFDLPIPAKGAKWVRFAAWDIASNGAVSQPMRTGAKPGKVSGQAVR
jgi:P pilus assembly chaperone PapD